jgi:hypothetical protein
VRQARNANGLAGYEPANSLGRLPGEAELTEPRVDGLAGRVQLLLGLLIDVERADRPRLRVGQPSSLSALPAVSAVG